MAVGGRRWKRGGLSTAERRVEGVGWSEVRGSRDVSSPLHSLPFTSPSYRAAPDSLQSHLHIGCRTSSHHLFPSMVLSSLCSREHVPVWPSSPSLSLCCSSVIPAGDMETEAQTPSSAAAAAAMNCSSSVSSTHSATAPASPTVTSTPSTPSFSSVHRSPQSSPLSTPLSTPSTPPLHSLPSPSTPPSPLRSCILRLDSDFRQLESDPPEGIDASPLDSSDPSYGGPVCSVPPTPSGRGQSSLSNSASPSTIPSSLLRSASLPACIIPTCSLTATSASTSFRTSGAPSTPSPPSYRASNRCCATPTWRHPLTLRRPTCGRRIRRSTERECDSAWQRRQRRTAVGGDRGRGNGECERVGVKRALTIESGKKECRYVWGLYGCVLYVES